MILFALLCPNFLSQVVRKHALGHTVRRMPRAAKRDRSHHSYYHRILLVSVVIATGLLIYIEFAGRKTELPQNKNLRAQADIANTPEYYTDVIGRVSSIDNGHIKLRIMVTDTQGTSRAHTYTVSVTEATSYQATFITDGAFNSQALAFADIKTNDTLQVFATENLADRKAFTANRIVKLINQ
jgi:hypothetical protein